MFICIILMNFHMYIYIINSLSFLLGYKNFANIVIKYDGKILNNRIKDEAH